MFIPINPNADKHTRAGQAAVSCKNGCLALPQNAPWLGAFENELFAFPGVKLMDQVDAFSQGIIYYENIIVEGYALKTGWVAEQAQSWKQTSLPKAGMKFLY